MSQTKSIAGKILVVEDAPELSALLIDLLDGAGYQVLHAAEGKSAVKMAIRENPDLILLDIVVPELDGIEVCRAVRHHPKTNKTKIVVLSALSGREDIETALSAGATDYVTKPFSKDKLLSAIKTAIQGK